MNVVLGIAGISLLIFVHELGHFLAAKWAGARVKTFSLGFDPTIRGVRLKLASWRWGETEYVIGLIPFGGYVRPADSEAGEGGEAAAEAGEFASQPPYKRAVIFAAGAGMNVAFGLAAFVLAFSLGVSFQSPEVGSVSPGSPAWYAGLRAGDRLAAIDGRKVESFIDVAVSAVLGGRSERLLTARRGDAVLDVRIVPRMDPEMGVPSLGLNPAVSRRIAAVEPGSSAARAGITPGDTIIGATFRPAGARVRLEESLPSTIFVGVLALLASQNPRHDFALRVESPDGATREVTLTSTPDLRTEMPRLGVMLARPSIQFVRPESEAASVFQPGELIVAINGEPVYLLEVPELAERFGDRSRLELRCDSGREFAVDRDAFFSWLLGHDLVSGDTRTAIRAVEAGSRADRAGLRPGDRIVAVAGRPLGHEATFADRLPEGPAEITFLREGETRTAVLQPGDQLGITWEHRPLVGWVQPGFPAAQAGIRPGDRIVELGDRKLDDWEDLVEYVHGHPDSEVQARVLRGGVEGAPGTLTSISLKPAKESFGSLGLSFEQARVTVRERNVAAAVALGAKRTVVSIKQILVTVLRLVRGEVATRNLQGPVGIIHLTGYVTRYGLGTLLFFLALISVNLGVLNLLPLPIFDGGHLLLLACEKIKGSPVNERIVQGATTVMFFLLIALAIYVTYHDVLRIVL